MKYWQISCIAILFCIYLPACSTVDMELSITEPESTSSESISQLDESTEMQEVYEQQDDDPAFTLTETDYEALRRTVPYPGLAPMWFGDSIPYSTSDVDETGKRLEYFLAYIGPLNNEMTAYELDNDYMLSILLQSATYLCAVRSLSGGVELLTPALEPIAHVVHDGSFVLKEHIDAAARELFGENTEIEHHSIIMTELGAGWIWHEEAGVYTPPHIGGRLSELPHVFEYADNEDHFEVEVIFYHSMKWTAEGDEFEKQAQEMDQEAINSAPHLLYTIAKNDDGTLTFESMRFLS